MNFLRCCDCSTDLNSVIIDDDLPNGSKILSDNAGRDFFSTNSTNTGKYPLSNTLSNRFLWSYIYIQSITKTLIKNHFYNY